MTRTKRGSFALATSVAAGCGGDGGGSGDPAQPLGQVWRGRVPSRARRLGLVLACALELALVAAPAAGAHVYWASRGNGSIARANLDGTGANVGLIVCCSAATGVAADGSHVYWTDTNATLLSHRRAGWSARR